MADFQIYTDGAGEYRWRMRADNYEIMTIRWTGLVSTTIK
jgi:uncharacterized protein YegP (UPF0339 family)